MPGYISTGSDFHIFLSFVQGGRLKFSDILQRNVRGSVHHSAIHKEKPQQDATVYQNVIILYLYEAQHVSGDTPPIIRSLKLHWRPLVISYVEGCWTCSWWTLSGTQAPDDGRCVARNMLRFIYVNMV
jgi:hypothetical protein